MFKQASIYRLNPDNWNQDCISEIQLAISSNQFKPCDKSQISSRGFVPPFKDKKALSSYVDGSLGMVLRTQQKILPSAAISEAVDEIVKERENLEGRKIGRKEKSLIRQNYIDEHLPNALAKSTYTTGIINSTHDLLFISDANNNRAEAFNNMLFQSLGALNIQLPRTNGSIGFFLSNCIENGGAENFTLGDTCKLVQIGDDGGVINAQKFYDITKVVADYLNGGMVCTELQLQYRDVCIFTLTDDFKFKGIKFINLLKESTDLDDLYQEEQFIMECTFSDIVQELVKLLGGWRGD